ncbi:MAG: DoxX family membrane protein [Candidatus Cyclobacteriaceae bacterium M2_1C_046]
MKANIGRVVFGLMFVIFGANHFMSAQQMGGMVPEWLPGGIFWVYLTGIALIAAGISVIINKKAALASLLLAILIFSFALFIHLPKVLGGDMMAMSSFLKDTTIAAAALFMSGILTD